MDSVAISWLSKLPPLPLQNSPSCADMCKPKVLEISLSLLPSQAGIDLKKVRRPPHFRKDTTLHGFSEMLTCRACQLAFWSLVRSLALVSVRNLTPDGFRRMTNANTYFENIQHPLSTLFSSLQDETVETLSYFLHLHANMALVDPARFLAPSRQAPAHTTGGRLREIMKLPTQWPAGVHSNQTLKTKEISHHPSGLRQRQAQVLESYEKWSGQKDSWVVCNHFGTLSNTQAAESKLGTVAAIGDS